ncbi:MAG: DUF177 domain-containing protein [Clostridia bacterium]|nr:DUF177 domain-containing protein [Clostridia bacterium]
MLDVSEATRNPGTVYSFDVGQAIAPQDVSGETVRFEEAHMWGTFEAMENGDVEVDGKLEVMAHARCANCLKDAQARVEADYRELFQLEGDPEDDEIFTYSSRVVDLEKLAMSYAVMHLPMRFLCKPDCREYVQYLQEQDPEPCQKELPGQHPFAALQQLLDEKNQSADQV